MEKMSPSISSLLLDSLYCQEQHLEEPELNDLTPLGEPEHEHQTQEEEEEEDEWAELLSSLAAKEVDMYPEHRYSLSEGVDNGSNSYLPYARQGMVDWVLRTCAFHGFSALTVVLAVNYLDRCFLGGSLRLQEDRPWMGRLSAVACLSLAAKVEETHVPLLLDLQAAAGAVEEEDSAGYVFEAKTVRRMELLVLSALGWRMNPVTPLSFIHHLLPKLNTQTPNATVASAHAILLSAIIDERWVRYPPSVWAVATLLQAMGQTPDPSEHYETHRLLSVLDLSKGKVEGCYRIISESMCVAVGIKRKKSSYSNYQYNYHQDYLSCPLSPDGVISSCFSCESSSSGGESWAMWASSVSSSPETPPYKRPNSGIAMDDEGDA